MKNKKHIKPTGKSIFYRKLLLAIGVIILSSYIYLLMALLLFAMMPTLVAFYLDKKNYEKIITIGFFNLAGVFPYLIELIFYYDTSTFIKILTGVLSWIVIYGSAGLGAITYYKLPVFCFAFIKKVHNFKLASIEKRLKKIQNTLGDI